MRKLVFLLALLPAAAMAQTPVLPKPELTEFWSPVPPKVEPGKNPGEPPSDAIRLFNGTDLAGWESAKGGPAQWAVENGELVDVPKAGDIQTAAKFGDIQWHVEWRVPFLPPDRKGQDRCNSGSYLQGL